MNNVGRMTYNFENVPAVQIPRSQFNRSHAWKGTFDAGYLIPFYVDEVLPGDTFKLKCNTFARLATLQVPLMENLYMDTFFFFVPYRLVWTYFVKMMGEQTNPGDSTSYTVPIATAPAGGYLANSLQDYMGLPVAVAGFTHSNLFCRAYNLIWNQWFRDENLQNSVTVDTGVGPDNVANYVLLRRGKRKDYFTSSLPWPQKGTAVTIPLGSDAPVDYYTGVGQPALLRKAADDSLLKNYALYTDSADGKLSVNVGGTYPSYLDPNDTLYADLSAATATTINELREAF